MMERRLAALEGDRGVHRAPSSGMSAILLLGMALLKAATTSSARRACSARRSCCSAASSPSSASRPRFVVADRCRRSGATAMQAEHPAAVRRDRRPIRSPRSATSARWPTSRTARGAWLAVDNCFCSPALQRPVEYGADFVMHSGTKYLDGQGRVIAGAICARRELVDDKFVPVMRSAGMTLSPFNAWVVLKGLETLSIRMQAQSARALALARWLERQPQVERVYYPGLASHPQHALAMAQQSGCGGAVVSFIVRRDGGRQQRAERLPRHRQRRASARSPPISATPRPRSPIRRAPRTAASPRSSAPRPASRRG